MLLGTQVRLRPLERRDLPLTVRWFLHPDTRAMVARSVPPSLVAQERWFDHVTKSGTEYIFVIEALREPGDLDAEGVPVGVCGLHEISWQHRGAVVGIVLGEEARGHGLGTEAMYLLCRHAQRDLGLHRIQLEVRPENQRAVKSYERLGFVREGVRRQALFKDGAWVDVILMSVVGDELQAPTGATPRKRKSAR